MQQWICASHCRRDGQLGLTMQIRRPLLCIRRHIAAPASWPPQLARIYFRAFADDGRWQRRTFFGTLLPSAEHRFTVTTHTDAADASQLPTEVDINIYQNGLHINRLISDDSWRRITLFPIPVNVFASVLLYYRPFWWSSVSLCRAAANTRPQTWIARWHDRATNAAKSALPN